MLEDLTHALELLLSPNDVARNDGHRLIADATPRLLHVAEALKAAVAAVLEAERCLGYPDTMSPIQRCIAKRKMRDATVCAEDARRMLLDAITDFGVCAGTELDCKEAEEDLCAPL